MSTVEIIRPVNETEHRADQVLVRKGESYFVVSSVDAPISGPETLVFRSNAQGEIEDWLEVAGGKRMTREEAIADLEGIA